MTSLLRRLGLGAKLWFSPAVTLVLMVVMAGGALLAMRQLQATVGQLVSVRTPNLLAVIALEQQVKDIHAASYRLLAWSTASYSTDQVTALSKSVSASLARTGEATQELRRLAGLSASDVEIVERVVGSVASFDTAIAAVLEMIDADQSVATTMMIKSEAPFARLTEDLGELRRRQQAAMNVAATDTTADMEHAQVAGAVVLAGCIVLATLITVAVRRSIMVPVLAIRAAASHLKDGDLTVHAAGLEGADEIARTAQAMADTVGTLRETIVSVNAAVGHMDTAIGEIAAGNEDLAARTEQQVVHLHHATANAAGLADAVKANSAGARAAVDLADLAKGRAEAGDGMVSELVEVMHEITASSKRVNDITSVIEGIAFQTNILALNAAVESARAGEHGRGFAVVASEVRLLAQRSATAAAEIKRLLATSGERVAAGGALVERTGSAVREVVGDVVQLHALVNEIATATDGQDRSIGEIACMLAGLDTTTQQNAALVEQAAAAAASMRQESARLVSAVGAFRT